ncbi:Remorin family protein [Forsythia ovata]|uniref:Remorin family protein n=1 Tax=Forsythia ovata TaxID=205694 RepID=A0ABD1UCP7_9LAMI
MKKNSASLRNSGAYTSPGTPEYGDNNVGGIPKGWSSERVPIPTNGSRRHINAAAFMPFNSGRTLPSKWDDAERWITSPVSGYGAGKSSILQPQRRPKSKSGPLGAPGLVYLSNYSPSVPVLEGGSVTNFVASSPLTTGVLVPDGLSIHYGAGISAKSNSLYAENSMARSPSVPGLSDMLSESSMPSSQDDKLDSTKKDEAAVSWDVSRRDMATQMSPEGSTHSASKGRLSFSSLPFPIPGLVEPHSNHLAKDEVRDVQVDKGFTVARQSKKHGPRKMRDSPIAADLPAQFDVAEASNSMSKLQREEAKITAWENLQKAKAEAAMRKLEVKLEKKRSTSMDKILNKLKAAQMKAQVLRNSLSKNHAQQAPRDSNKWVFFCKYVRMGSLSNCFCCRRN